MITISVCMIVRDEEDVLGRCLECAAQFADEIVVVDTGSKDRTKEIAAQFTNRIYDFLWIDDFAAARNESFSKATMQYCMWLDADDVIEPGEIEKLRKLKKELDPSVDLVRMQYQTGFDAQGNPTFSYVRERLVKRGTFHWTGAIHEVIVPHGKIIDVPIAISHKKLHPSDPDRNLRIFEKLLAEGKTLDPRQQFYYARELYYHQRYAEAEAELLRFLEGGNGWIENVLDACRVLASCYREEGRYEEAVQALVRSFLYDVPRAEACCDLGWIFMQQKKDRQAIYWYSLALTCQKQTETGGFIEDDCYGYLPCIQLCVLYDRQGNHELAERYNEKAGQYKPEDRAVRQNRDYFERYKKAENK